MAAKNNSKKKKRPRARRIYSDEFRADVVCLCQAGDETIPEVCKCLDLTVSAVRGRIKKAEDGESSTTDHAASITTSEKEELQRLRRENKQLKMERDIFKKAATFFAKENT